MNVVNRQSAGSGNGTNPYDVASTWLLNLDFVPTPGNTLILYLGLPTNASIDTMYCGGATIGFAYSGGVSSTGLVVAICTVTSPPQTNFSIVFGEGGTLFSSIVEEVQGITSLTCDQIATASGSGPAYNTNPTSETTRHVEYWSNCYAYYNAAVDHDPVGSSPTNGYALYSAAPVKHYQTGWQWAFPNPTSSAPTISAGLLLASKAVTTEGTAGGAVTDSNGNVNNYFGAALTFFGPPTSIPILTGGSPPTGGLIRFPPLRTL